MRGPGRGSDRETSLDKLGSGSHVGGILSLTAGEPGVCQTPGAFAHPDPRRRAGPRLVQTFECWAETVRVTPGTTLASETHHVTVFCAAVLTCSPTGDKMGQNAWRSVLDLEPEQEKPCFPKSLWFWSRLLAQ